MRLLTPAAERLLKILAEPDAELTYAKGGGWWVGTTRFAGRSAQQLLWLCVIRCTHGHLSDYQVYEITAEGRRLLADPTYEPEIVKHMRSR